MRVCGLYLSGSGEGTVVVYCERCNEHLILVKCGEFFIAAGIKASKKTLLHGVSYAVSLIL
jgi:hypothetical protein